jgi:hypothetical protein
LIPKINSLSKIRRSHFLTNEGGRGNLVIMFAGARDGLIIVLAGARAFGILFACTGGLDLLSQRTVPTDARSRHADGAATDGLPTSNLCRIRGRARLRSHLGVRWLPRYRARGRERLYHRHHARASVPLQSGTEGGIATAYDGVPSHYPTSIPTSTQDESSLHYQHHFVGVPTRCICMKEHVLRWCSKTKEGQFLLVHTYLLSRNSSTREGLIPRDFQMSSAIFTTSKESCATAASNQEIGAGGKLSQVSNVSKESCATATSNQEISASGVLSQVSNISKESCATAA